MTAFIWKRGETVLRSVDGAALADFLGLKSCSGIWATIATFRLEYEDELPYWARALGSEGKSFRSVRAQSFKLVVVVVLVLQSEGC